MRTKLNLLLFFLSLILFPAFCMGQEAIIVPLATESQLQPIAVALKTSPQFTPHYWKQLQDVLYFDLTHSGWLQPIRANMDIEDQILEDSKVWAFWKSYSAHFGLYLQADGSQLRAKIFNLSTRKISSLSAMSLAGNIDKDRQLIHQLCDSMIRLFFQSPSAALSKIVYTVAPSHNSAKPSTQVWQADYDGANAKLLFDQPNLIVNPSYLPGSHLTKLSFVSYKLGQPKIMLSNLQGQCRRACALGGSQLAPCFDKHGKQLSFICDVEGNPDIYHMNVDLTSGKAQAARRIFSSKRGTQASPAFSHDGKRLAFVSSKDGHPRIYIIDISAYLQGADPDKARLISRKNRENTCPCWSPDGRYIAYSARSLGPRQIWIYDTVSQTETCLTQDEGIHENPSWAPDSLHLYYNCENTSGCHLYMIDLNRQEPVRITRHHGITRFASCAQ